MLWKVTVPERGRVAKEEEILGLLLLLLLLLTEARRIGDNNEDIASTLCCCCCCCCIRFRPGTNKFSGELRMACSPDVELFALFAAAAGLQFASGRGELNSAVIGARCEARASETTVRDGV